MLPYPRALKPDTGGTMSTGTARRVIVLGADGTQVGTQDDPLITQEADTPFTVFFGAVQGLYLYTAGAQDPVIAFRVKADSELAIHPLRVRGAVEGNKPVIVSVYGAPTITGGTWLDTYAGVSELEYQLTPTVADVGVLLDTIPLGKSSEGVADFTGFRLRQPAGAMSLITVESTGNTELLWSISWREQ